MQSALRLGFLMPMSPTTSLTKSLLTAGN
ncbi:hypothetical protein SS209_00549 [Salmonella enterica subsp. enterica serovar Senftenberg str. SS209]|nr:hypothetical protein SS209_00549 [Salmonella enterica subsp. enterica serovar Senftenberg str. SS209]